MQNLKLTTLNHQDTPEYYPFLEECMKDQAIELIHQSKLLTNFDAKTLANSLNYSLWYSQGDGVSFRKWQYTKTLTYWKTQKEILFFVATNSYSNHYSHEKTFYIGWELQSNYGNWMTTKEEKKMEELANEYTEELRSICKQLEKYWYDIIDEENEDSILSIAFERWKDTNHIESIDSLFDFPYSTTEQDDYTHIATDGNTNLKGLWVQLPPLEKQERVNEFFTFNHLINKA